MDEDIAAAGFEPGDRLAQLAARRIKARSEFRGHLLVYAGVNTMLAVIWLVTALSAGSWFPWFVFPLTGWGIGVAAHAWTVYGSPSRPLTHEAIMQEIERMRREQSQR
jgi:hypothetical protein